MPTRDEPAAAPKNTGGQTPAGTADTASTNGSAGAAGSRSAGGSGDVAAPGDASIPASVAVLTVDTDTVTGPAAPNPQDPS